MRQEAGKAKGECGCGYEQIGRFLCRESNTGRPSHTELSGLQYHTVYTQW
jgi:hypothetical protein